ncbi:MAG: GFA family protein [Hyphomonadaceae bacterium]|nr:GFA family protein [Hyphomonadaceae bacterium]
MSQVKAPVAEGGCQCGAVRYAFYAPLENSHACHCRMCQRAVGGAFALLAGGKKENFAWTKGAPAFFASSNLAHRGFCAACGTPLSFAYDMPEARIYVTSGSLDAPEGAPIVIQYGVESRWSWIRFCEDVSGEETGAASPQAAEFFAGMKSNQG